MLHNYVQNKFEIPTENSCSFQHRGENEINSKQNKKVSAKTLETKLSEREEINSSISKNIFLVYPNMPAYLSIGPCKKVEYF